MIPGATGPPTDSRVSVDSYSHGGIGHPLNDPGCDSEIQQGARRHVQAMRRILSVVCWALLPLGCGFDTVAPVAPATAGSSSGGSTSGGGASGSAGMTGSGGTASTAGQSTGMAGTNITAMGGSANQGGSGGNAGSGNAGGSGTSGAGGGTAVDPHFKLAWRDDFDRFVDTRWSKQTHTFEENLARFSAANVVVEGGRLLLKVTKVQNGDKAYSGAEVASKDQFTFGRFAARIKFCAGSGMVSSLFTYKENVDTSWQEIDIEHLGYLGKSMQYNLISGNLANRVYQPKVVTFTWAPPADFHDYVMEWRPDGVTFFVDGAQTHHDVQVTLKDAAGLRMNAWPTDNSVTSFAGPFDATAVPCEAQYDWVEAYHYVP